VVVSDLGSAEAAFRRIYEAHYGSVLAYSLRRADDATAQDAAAEVFMIVWKKIDQRPPEPKILSWLYGIAYRVIGHLWRGRDRYRRLKSRISTFGDDFSPGPETLIVQRSEHRRLMDAVHKLSATDREVLALAGWEELSHSEIADILGISVAAVDQRFHRAKKRLAKRYEELTESHNGAAGDGGVT
jgi:RNA polymerase sigma-70 factor (ECF subfamily)